MYMYIELQVDVIVVRGEKLPPKHVLGEGGELYTYTFCQLPSAKWVHRTRSLKPPSEDSTVGHSLCCKIKRQRFLFL